MPWSQNSLRTPSLWVCRGQTTQGIWLAAAQVPLETFTLVLDLEGTDGRERGEVREHGRMRGTSI